MGIVEIVTPQFYSQFSSSPLVSTGISRRVTPVGLMACNRSSCSPSNLSWPTVH